MLQDMHASAIRIRWGDDRYSQDRRRYELALRMLARDVRTSVISEWTGLTHSRIRSMWRTLADELPNKAKRRRRGKPPFDVHCFLRSPQAQAESAVVASLFVATGLVSAEAIPNLRGFSGVTRGELLCELFDLYCALSPDPERLLLTMEHFVLLLVTLVKRDELVLWVCDTCECIIVRDRLSLEMERCAYCAVLTPVGAEAHQGQGNIVPASNTRGGDEFPQNDLFGEAAAGSSFQTDPFSRGISSE